MPDKESFVNPPHMSWFTAMPPIVLLALVFFMQACEPDDPEPVNEEELITTFHIALTPAAPGEVVDLTFYDADGESGSIAPVVTVSGPLQASTVYTAVVELMNETVAPTLNISAEVAEEAEAHLFCYDADGGITITYEDEDANGLPLGLETSWATGGAGAASVTISLRHQEGTKTGECPGGGETDVQVTFDLVIR